jgi:hypothetical protein
MSRMDLSAYTKALKLDDAKLGNDAGLVGAAYYCMKRHYGGKYGKLYI